MKIGNYLYHIRVRNKKQVVDYDISEIKHWKCNSYDGLIIDMYPIVGDMKNLQFNSTFQTALLKSLHVIYDGTDRHYLTISKKAFLNFLKSLPEEGSNLASYVM